MRRNHTFVFLIILVLGFLIGTISNIYFIFYPSNYAHLGLNPHSLWNWINILLIAFITAYLFFIAQKVKDKYAKKLWLFLSASFTFGILKEFLIRGTTELSQIIAASESLILFLVLLMFLFLYRKHKFDLFAGLNKNNYGPSVVAGARLVIRALFIAILGVAAWMLL